MITVTKLGERTSQASFSSLIVIVIGLETENCDVICCDAAEKNSSPPSQNPRTLKKSDFRRQQMS